jgi:hypothetical protein
MRAPQWSPMGGAGTVAVPVASRVLVSTKKWILQAWQKGLELTRDPFGSQRVSC